MQSCLAEAMRYHNPQAFGHFAIRAYGHQDIYRLSELPRILEHQPVPPDLMISQAEYLSPRNRKITNVLRVGVNFVDCDLENSQYAGLRPSQMVPLILTYCEDVGIPCPNVINFSGRGYHCKWILSAPVPQRGLARWKWVQKTLAAHLSDLGADKNALDAARCLRAVGTLNIKSKTGETARTVWDDGGSYDFDSLADAVLPHTRAEVADWWQEIEAQDAERAARKAAATAQGKIRSQPSNLWAIPDLYCYRLDDVRTLCSLRGWQNGVPDGHRGNVLFVATICAFWAFRPSNLEAEAQELARQLCPSLSTTDVRGRVCNIVAQAKTDKPYRLKTQTILDKLSIVPREQCEMRTLVDAAERKRRKSVADCLNKRKHCDRETYLAQAQRRRDDARSLQAQGLKHQQIADHLGITLNSVKARLRKQASPIL